MSSAQVKSAVVSVNTPGVLPTGMPRRVQAGTSMLSKPTAIWLTTLRWGAASSSSSSMRSVNRQYSASLSATFSSRAARGMGRSLSHRSTSQCAATMSMPGWGTRRVINTFGFTVASIVCRMLS